MASIRKDRGGWGESESSKRLNIGSGTIIATYIITVI